MPSSSCSTKTMRFLSASRSSRRAKARTRSRRSASSSGATSPPCNRRLAEGLVGEDGAAARRAAVHEHDVDRDPVQPRAELRLAPEVLQALVDLDEDFLDDVLQVAPAAQHAVDEPRDVGPVPVVELAEGGGVVCGGPRDEACPRPTCAASLRATRRQARRRTRRADEDIEAERNDAPTILYWMRRRFRLIQPTAAVAHDATPASMPQTDPVRRCVNRFATRSQAVHEDRARRTRRDRTTAATRRRACAEVAPRAPRRPSFRRTSCSDRARRIRRAARRSTFSCFFCSRSWLTACSKRVFVGPLSVSALHRGVQGAARHRAARARLPRLLGRALGRSSAALAWRLFSLMARSSGRSFSISCDAARMRRGSSFLAAMNWANFVSAMVSSVIRASGNSSEAAREPTGAPGLRKERGRQLDRGPGLDSGRQAIPR